MSAIDSASPTGDQIAIDHHLLLRLGFDELHPDRAAELLWRIRQELELRVGRELAEGFTDEQLAHFQEVAEDGDERATRAWLLRAAPGYPGVVRRQYGELCLEIARRQSQIHQASSQASR